MEPVKVATVQAGRVCLSPSLSGWQPTCTIPRCGWSRWM